MLSENVLLSLNSVRDDFLDDTWEKLNRQTTVKNKHRKVLRTALIAAVIVALLTVSAFAIGYSFYRIHQANVREELKIEENHVSGYVEYEEESISGTSAENAANIQPISSIDCGEYIKVYFCVSPVSPETFEGAFRSGDFGSRTCLFQCFTGNDERITDALELKMRGEEIPCNYDAAYASVGISLTEDEIQEHSEQYTGENGEIDFEIDPEYYWDRIADCYDEETQSLFLQCIIRKANIDTAKPIYIAVGLLDSESVVIPLGEQIDIDEWRKEHLPFYIENYGTTVIDAAQADSRIFDLSNGFVELTNPSNGGELKILSAAVYPTYMEFKVTHDDIQSVFNLPEEDSEAYRNGFEKQLEWTRFYDAILQNSEILLAGGGTLSLVPSESIPYENGIVTLRSYFTSTVDISRVEGLNIYNFEIQIVQ